MQNFDEKAIAWAERVAIPFARFSIFLVYFYFGAIKVFAISGAANPLVIALLNKTLSGIDAAPFLVAFGVFEMVLGLIFIIPHLQRLGLFLLALHIFVIILPLFILPNYTWQGFLVPTLEGQYIIKNILIIAVGIFILARLRPLNQNV